MPLSSSYTPGLHANFWAGIPLGTRLQLSPSIHFYDLGGSYGAGTGLRIDVSLAFQYVIRLGRVELLPGMVVSAAFRGPPIGDLRGVGFGISVTTQGQIYGPLGVYARAIHRLVVTYAEGLFVHQFDVGALIVF